jgi:hypothetical protein
MQSRNFWLSREVLICLAVFALVAIPAVVFGGSKTVFVDKDASGSEDGTSSHPYHSIGKALDHVKDGTEVHVAKGTYKENITLPKGIKLIGKKKDRGAVVIDASNGERPAVTMKHDTELDHVTVVGGRHGVRVLESSKVVIYDVVVKNSNRDGIHIDSASRDKKYQAIISKTEIRNSDRAGIFSEKRNLVIVDSNVHDNKSDGIDLAGGMKAWVANSRFNNNKGSGVKLTLDGASVTLKSNSIRYNSREGVEVNAYGVAGFVGVNKSSLISNGRYGIARIARTNSAFGMFGGVALGTGVNVNRIDTNSLGNISSLLGVF